MTVFSVPPCCNSSARPRLKLGKEKRINIPIEKTISEQALISYPQLVLWSNLLLW